jgi:signal transduction histidine kinase
MGRAEIDDPITMLGAVTDRRLSALRLKLAVAALLIIYLIPSEPGNPVRLTLYCLAAYTIYSVALFLVARRTVNFSPPVMRSLVVADLVWYTVLTSISSGNHGLYFFYLFAVIVASSRGGAVFGFLITVLSCFLCITVGWLAAPPGPFDQTRFVMRPLAVLGLGYILSYWGGAELALKRKLILLKELSLAANPRFGVDWTIELILRRLMRFWDASYCLILLAHDTGLHLYLVSSDDPNRCQNVRVQGQADIPFIDIADSAAVVYNDRPRVWPGGAAYSSYDPGTHAITPRDLPPGEALAEFLSARSFVGVPLHYRERLRGRILVSSTRAHAFNVGDAVFLQQVANQIVPVIENIRLVERLASDASEEERNRIARSVHDRVIQPYYGLQIGLKALQSVLNNGGNGGNGKGHNGDPVSGLEKKPAVLLEELMTMTSDGIDELRQYVSGLKQSRVNGTHLSDSIRRFASKFEHATGIHVKVVDDTGGFVGNDRLTAEMFQMAAEALSNVHRHTRARSARVALSLEGNAVRLQVENELAGTAGPARFTPGSISDRAEALGGTTEVLSEEGRTVLRVEVPL